MDQFEKEEDQIILEQKVILIKHFLDEAVKCFGEKNFQEALEQLIVIITLAREMIFSVNRERFRQRDAITLKEAQRKIPPRHVMWYELKERYLPHAKLFLEESQRKRQTADGCERKGAAVLYGFINEELAEPLRKPSLYAGEKRNSGFKSKELQEPPFIPPMSIGELDLSIRAENCLHRGGIETVEQLTEMKASELKMLRNFGAKCFQEVVEKLAKRNLSLREE